MGIQVITHEESRPRPSVVIVFSNGRRFLIEDDGEFSEWNPNANRPSFPTVDEGETGDWETKVHGEKTK
jgi:hypothetical protein